MVHFYWAPNFSTFLMDQGLEVDERNAQQFVEQLGPGKRPLWAVPVVLRPVRKTW